MKAKLTRKKSLMEGTRFGHRIPDYVFGYIEKAASPINKDYAGGLSLPQIFLGNKKRGSNRMKPKIRIRQKH